MASSEEALAFIVSPRRWLVLCIGAAVPVGAPHRLEMMPLDDDAAASPCRSPAAECMAMVYSPAMVGWSPMGSGSAGAASPLPMPLRPARCQPGPVGPAAVHSLHSLPAALSSACALEMVAVTPRLPVSPGPSRMTGRALAEAVLITDETESCSSGSPNAQLRLWLQARGECAVAGESPAVVECTRPPPAKRPRVAAEHARLRMELVAAQPAVQTECQPDPFGRSHGVSTRRNANHVQSQRADAPVRAETASWPMAESVVSEPEHLLSPQPEWPRSPVLPTVEPCPAPPAAQQQPVPSLHARVPTAIVLADAPAGGHGGRLVVARASAQPAEGQAAPNGTRLPWAQWAASFGTATQKARAATRPAYGQLTLLVGKPWPRPQGYTPRVYGKRADERELERRLVEALRIAPAVSKQSWMRMLDMSAGSLDSLLPRVRAQRQLDALCGIVGHATMARWRASIHHLSAFQTREEGLRPRECMSTRVGASSIKALLDERAEEADERARAQRQRACHSGNERAIARSRDPDEEEGGGPHALLTSLTSVMKALCLDWACEHPILAPYTHRVQRREGVQAVTPELGFVLHCELLAADPMGCGAVYAGCAAMAARMMHLAPRTALGVRSDQPSEAANGMVVAYAGMDPKKRKWRSAGRPLIASRYGFSGSDAWVSQSQLVTSERPFADSFRSLLRAHNGAGGDLSKATAWLDRPPTNDEWQQTLRCVAGRAARWQRPDGSWCQLGLSLVGRTPELTPHSLKRVKPSAYVSVRVHTDYVPEATAHAGSTMERMSVGGACGNARAIRPSGLRVALGYARDALAVSAVEVDHIVFRLVRAFVAKASADVLRDGSWTALARWAMSGGADTTELVGVSWLQMARAIDPPIEQDELVSESDDDGWE